MGKRQSTFREQTAALKGARNADDLNDLLEDWDKSELPEDETEERYDWR